MIEQLIEADVQVGWNTRLVPFGPTYTSAVFAIGLVIFVFVAFKIVLQIPTPPGLLV